MSSARGSWIPGVCAGGAVHFPSFHTNPQYLLHIKEPGIAKNFPRISCKSISAINLHHFPASRAKQNNLLMEVIFVGKYSF